MLIVSQFQYTSLCNYTYLYAYLILLWSGVCVFYHSHCNSSQLSHNVLSLTCSLRETNSYPSNRKVLSYNTQPARSTANAIKNATDLYLPARKIISLCLKFRTHPLYSYLIGSTLSCLNTIKFTGYEHKYDSLIHTV